VENLVSPASSRAERGFANASLEYAGSWLNGGGDVLACPMGNVFLVALTGGEWVSFGPQQVNGTTSVWRSIPGIHSGQTVESQAMR
jgi:hypothetical protein